jgi:hypothetical protein
MAAQATARKFGKRVSNEGISVEAPRALDAKMEKAALAEGYDSVVLMTPAAFSAFNRSGKLPRSMELNIFDVGPQSTR